MKIDFLIGSVPARSSKVNTILDSPIIDSAIADHFQRQPNYYFHFRLFQCIITQITLAATINYFLFATQLGNMNIYPIPLGVEQGYIIQGEGVVMIDGGAPNKAKAFIKGLKKTLIKPEEIKLIIITHGHWDHIGSAKDIKDITGAKIAMHNREKDWLEKSLKPLPPGVTRWGKIFAKTMALFTPFIHVPATHVDIILGDEDFSLAEFGIAGKVISTPGHSPGSVTVILDTGDAFVGDLAMNAFPMCLRPSLPIFAEDLQKVKDSWKLIFDCGVKTIYPAHGNPFPADIMPR